MTVVSNGFLLFVILCTAVFCLTKIRYRWVILLLFSLFMFAAADPIYPVFLLVTAATAFAAARYIGKIKEQIKQIPAELSPEERKKKKEQLQKRAKLVLLMVLFLNIGYLAGEKLFNYAFGRAGNNLIVQVVVPIGISYYTFSCISYVLDIYWGRYGVETSFPRFLTFAAYFPHIMQGPISRYDRLGSELKKPLRMTAGNTERGVQRILWGLIKKLIIAERLSPAVTAVFGDAQAAYSGSIYLLALLADVIYLYADFSGYMDIMCGISLIFGIQLEENFNSPFHAMSIADFWRRWHMTMGGWFKDYVFYPVSNSKLVKKLGKKPFMKAHTQLRRIVVTVIPVYCTWILTGLWHGDSFGYVAWGIYYSTLIAISVITQPFFNSLHHKMGINEKDLLWRILQHTKVLLLFMFGRALTKGDSFIHSTGMILSRLPRLHAADFFRFDLIAADQGITVFLLLSMAVLFGVDTIKENREPIGVILQRQNFVIRAAVYILGVAVLLALGTWASGNSTFAYQQF